MKLLKCSCCGKYLNDTPEENIDFESGRRDAGFGTCFPCAEWSTDRFFGGHIETAAKAMKPENEKKFRTWPREKQINFVADMFEKGVFHY